MCRALLAGLDPSLTADDATVATTYWPSCGVDLVLEAQRRGHGELIVVEHKRFSSPSHAPGYKKNEDALWQTDQVYQPATSGYWPGWMHETDSDLPVRFVVLDGYGKHMDQMFPGGLHNSEWSVTGYGQFASVLRAEPDRGTRGLTPLLTTVYAGVLAEPATQSTRSQPTTRTTGRPDDGLQAVQSSRRAPDCWATGCDQKKGGAAGQVGQMPMARPTMVPSRSSSVIFSSPVNIACCAA